MPNSKFFKIIFKTSKFKSANKIDQKISALKKEKRNQANPAVAKYLGAPPPLFFFNFFAACPAITKKREKIFSNVLLPTENTFSNQRCYPPKRNVVVEQTNKNKTYCHLEHRVDNLEEKDGVKTDGKLKGESCHF